MNGISNSYQAIQPGRITDGPQVESNFNKAFGRLVKMVEMAENLNAKINTRLEPIKRSMAYPSGESVKRPAINSPICEAMELLSDRIHELNESNSRLLDSLDV